MDYDYLYKFPIPFKRRLHMKFKENCPFDFRGETVQRCERTNDGQRLESDHDSLSCVCYVIKAPTLVRRYTIVLTL